MADRIVWTDLAVEQLSALWLDSNDRAILTATVNRLERALLHHPALPVEPVAEGLIRYVLPPLQVLYSVDGNSKTIEIAAVKRA